MHKRERLMKKENITQGVGGLQKMFAASPIVRVNKTLHNACVMYNTMRILPGIWRHII